jgi:hypothetical protein
MKTVCMARDFSYRAKARVFVQYLGGATYDRVPDAAVRAIPAAKAGRVIEREEVSE